MTIKSLVEFLRVTNIILHKLCFSLKKFKDLVWVKGLSHLKNTKHLYFLKQTAVTFTKIAFTCHLVEINTNIMNFSMLLYWTLEKKYAFTLNTLKTVLPILHFII